MTVFNRIQQFIDKRGITRYRFWQETGLGKDTAYRLCNDPSYIPTGQVLDKICSAYRMQPGEFLEWQDKSQNKNPISERSVSEKLQTDNLIDRTNIDSDAKSVIKLKVVYSNKEAS